MFPVIHFDCSSLLLFVNNHLIKAPMNNKLLLVSTLLFNISQEPPSHTSRMSSCPTCERPLILPPSISHLLKEYPDVVTPLYDLNRRIPRCKHCDLLTANKRAMDAELPPPHYKSPVTNIEQDMEEARRFMAQGIRKVEMEASLVRMAARRREVILKREQDIRKAWEEYWGIWGPEESGIGSLYN